MKKIRPIGAIVVAAVLLLSLAACEGAHAHTWDPATGKCSECGEEHGHSYIEDGLCTECGYVCTHDYVDGACKKCGKPTVFKWEHFDQENEPLLQPCAHQGTVTSLEYDTPAYAVNDLFHVEETLHKKLNVYLPYGYDETKQYNVLYLLHGTKGAADGEMEDYWLASDLWGEYTRNLLDNMIDKGLCEPLIVVTPCYYSIVDGYNFTDAEMSTVAQRLGDTVIETPEEDLWPIYFGQELRGNIIPLVEATYSTYAGGDVSESGLIASRDHRAFAGESRGSMAVVRSGITDNADLFSYFGSFSGIWQEFSNLKASLEGQFADYEIKCWFNGNGKNDFALDNHEAFRDKVLSEMGDRFIDGENYHWVYIKDGAHIYWSWLLDLYNSLLVFYH